MAKRSSRQTTQRIALSGLLIAIMLVLGYLERFIPMPIPQMKLGLSNSVLIFAVYMLDLPTAWLLMLLKVALSGLMFGTFLSTGWFLALAGGVLSMAAMTLLSRIKGFHIVTVSMMGSVMHIIGQIIAIMILAPSPAYLKLLGLLMLTGLGFGALTGICATAVMKQLKHTGFYHAIAPRKAAVSPKNKKDN